jgi:hypothetical protein
LCDSESCSADKNASFSSETSICSDDELECVWYKIGLKVSGELYLGITGLNVVSDNPEEVAEVVSALIGDELIQLFIDHANLCHTTFYLSV